MDVLQVINTNGAARRLGCTRTWIHKLVAARKLRAYVYDENGVLVEHRPEQKRQGQGLYFFIADIDQYRTEIEQHPRRNRQKNPLSSLRNEQTQNGNHL